MEGEQSEHEEEKGSVKLHDHPFNKELSIADVYDVPFRELWMRDGRADLRAAGPARDRPDPRCLPRRTTSSSSSTRVRQGTRGRLVEPGAGRARCRPGERRRRPRADRARRGRGAPRRSEALARGFRRIVAVGRRRHLEQRRQRHPALGRGRGPRPGARAGRAATSPSPSASPRATSRRCAASCRAGPRAAPSTWAASRTATS